MLREPCPVPVRPGRSRIHPFDLGNGTQVRDPSVHVVRIVGDGAPVGRGEYDEELVEGSEALQERPERRRGLAVARQQAQHIGVEGEASEAEPRQQDEHQRRTHHQSPPAVGPRNDELDR